MKKCLIILAAAAVLTGCAENELTTPEEMSPAEITFTTAPLTKAGTFDTDKIFQTYAFYTTSAFDYTSGEEYIPASTVSYGTDDAWRTTGKTYLWPKDGGALSFFSWSLNSTGLKYNDGTTPKVSFSATDGITLTGYSSVGDNDFMVADPALNLSENVKTYSHTGVPTLFRHKASQISFKVKTSKTYAGRTFSVTGISFANVSTSGKYVQGSAPTNSTASTEAWTPDDASGTTTSYYSSTEGTTFADTEVTVPVNGTSIFVPQTFTETDGKTVTVNYTVTTGTTVTAKSATISMNKLLGGGSNVAFIKGKYYTVTLVFSVGNEILWTPEVKDWTGVAEEVTVG